ncbi:hypothetical protein V1478_009498 [Vespula squamosa]|uniref:Uncharacterized protein n=1 Tax=Vespula squamosa TaxID=30214 RepID=A0ABD2ARY0_VESSQ
MNISLILNPKLLHFFRLNNILIFIKITYNQDTEFTKAKINAVNTLEKESINNRDKIHERFKLHAIKSTNGGFVYCHRFKRKQGN